MNETFLETVKKIKDKGGSCRGIDCAYCPFSRENNNNRKSCVGAGFSDEGMEKVPDKKMLKSCEEYIAKHGINVGDIVEVFDCSWIVLASDISKEACFDLRGERWEVLYTGMILPTPADCRPGHVNDVVVKGVKSGKIVFICSKYVKKQQKKMQVLGLSAMFGALIAENYEPDACGFWHGDGAIFYPKMWYSCGKDKNEDFDYEPWMLEEV